MLTVHDISDIDEKHIARTTYSLTSDPLGELMVLFIIEQVDEL